MVLIPKAGGDISARPIKARPICLLSVTGKTFERVIVGRLMSWMAEYLPARLLDNQFGFRQGLSTHDALLRFRSIVETTVADGGIVIAVSIDVSNAFNSIPFSQIMAVLKRGRFPLYLVVTIRDYLVNRTVEYPVTGNRVVQRAVRAGVPQGSVFGPLLWNLAYNEVLETELEPGCFILGYADDTLVVATANSVETAEIRANMQTAAVMRRILRIGLKVATDDRGYSVLWKTEAYTTSNCKSG